MNYYELAVEARGLKMHNTLTYASVEALSIGSIVRVSLRNKNVNALVFKKVNKPKYDTKEISEVLYPAAIPFHILKTMQWMEQYYATSFGSIVQSILPRGANKKRRSAATLTKTGERAKLATKLTADQTAALKTIADNPNKTVLLHGVTGSGKTRIYIERARQALNDKKGSIILVPEIGLTSQMVADFKQVFPDVFVIHSNLTEATRTA